MAKGGRELHDHYFRLAKQQGYLSRAAFKLIEIDDRRRLVRRGDWVLDAGCAPGAWLQVLSKRVGPSGRVFGVDLKEVDGRLFDPNVRTVAGDFTTVTLEELLGPWRRDDRPAPFDAMLSDMGPDTTGDPAGDSARSVRLCHVLLDRAAHWLRPGGNLLMKVYEGGEYPGLLVRARREFEEAKGFKPQASRGESVEMYVVCLRRRSETSARPAPGADEGGSSAEPSEATPPRRRRSAGWGQ